MKENDKPYKCERCGSDCAYFRKGTSHGWKCENCDFMIATSYMSFEDVSYYYEIRFKPELPMAPEKYKYLSGLFELNYLQLKQAVGKKEFAVTKDIYETLDIMEKLDELGIKHNEMPPYPYSPHDEMHHKIKSNTVFSDDIG